MAEVAVIGVQSQKWGETLLAVIVGEEESTLIAGEIVT
jgi:acyl-CoA synthetase (AMP-forming)/AMP-acid ligase II